MSLFGNTSSYSSNQTSVSTQTATDSYNQSAVRTENLSDVGNVTVTLGEKSFPLASIFPILILAVGAFFLYKFFIKKG